MWGPGLWITPMWGFWWIFPVIGLLICLVFIVVVVRIVSSGGHVMCMGPHLPMRLRREIEELREELKKQGS